MQSGQPPCDSVSDWFCIGVLRSGSADSTSGAARSTGRSGNRATPRASKFSNLEARVSAAATSSVLCAVWQLEAVRPPFYQASANCFFEYQIQTRLGSRPGNPQFPFPRFPIWPGIGEGRFPRFPIRPESGIGEIPRFPIRPGTGNRGPDSPGRGFPGLLGRQTELQ